MPVRIHNLTVTAKAGSLRLPLLDLIERRVSGLFGRRSKAPLKRDQVAIYHHATPPADPGDLIRLPIRELRTRQAMVEGRLASDGRFESRGRYSETNNYEGRGPSIPEVYWVDWTGGPPFWALLDGNHRVADAYLRGIEVVQAKVGWNPPETAKNAMWGDKPWIPFEDSPLWADGDARSTYEDSRYVGTLRQERERRAGTLHLKPSGIRPSVFSFLNRFRRGESWATDVPGEGHLAIGTLRVVWPGGAGQARRSAEDDGPVGVPPGFEYLLDRSSGFPLPSGVRALLEPMFGSDLGGVRLHTDAPAQEASRAIGAQAFTFGRDIYFSPGRYQPGSATGLALLGHELTHVAQEMGGAPTLGGGGGGGGGLLKSSGGGGGQLAVAGHDALERQAEWNERAILHGWGRDGASSSDLGSGPGLHAGPVGGGLRLKRGYPGALALKAEEAAGGVPAAPPPPSGGGGLDDVVALLRRAGPALGTAADVAIGFVPVVGDVYDVLCGVIGRAIFTWEELDVWERILCFVGVIPIPFVSGAILRRGKRALQWVLSEQRALGVLSDLVQRGVAFVSRHVARVRRWAEGLAGGVRRGVADLAQAVRSRVDEITSSVRTRLGALQTGSTSEAYKALEEGAAALQKEIERLGYKFSAATYYEYRALRAQGKSPIEAHNLMKRFREGEEVEGWAFHFARPASAQGIIQDGKLRAGPGYVGHGVYAGTTPTPSDALQRYPVIGWGLGTPREVRIPIEMTPERQAFKAVLPTKTYLFEVTEDMALGAKSIKDIARNDGVLSKLWFRYRTLAMAAILAIGTPYAAWELLSRLFFKRRTLEDALGMGTEQFAERLRQRNLERALLSPGPGLPLEAGLRHRLELLLGEPLGDVRLHTGLEAERLSEALEADAFTLDEQVFLRRAPDPTSPEDLALLTHEATHALQARRGRLAGGLTPGVVESLEAEADAREDRAIRRLARPAPAPRPRPELLLRQAAPPPPPEPEPELVAIAPAAARPGPARPPARPAPTLRRASQQQAREGDPVRRVLEAKGLELEREEFLAVCRRRILAMLRDELEQESERRESLAWTWFRPPS